MTGVWPWIAVAGLGALHGLNPAMGWALAAACGVNARDGRHGHDGRDGREAMRALLPIAAGHAASVLLVAALVGAALQWGLPLQPVALQVIAAVALAVLGLRHWRHRGERPIRMAHAHAGLALWSFIAATAHGAGLMLVPALVPLCMGEGAVREITASGSLALCLAAAAVHLAAMLAVTALGAAGAVRLVTALRRP